MIPPSPNEQGKPDLKSYYRVMLGKGSVYAAECFAGGFIGADFAISEDLSRSLPDEWRQFNKKFIPVFMEGHAGKSKVTAGLACGALWTIAKGMRDGDIVLSPTGAGTYRVGEITGGYYYAPEGPLPHRRRVSWCDLTIARDAMSETLRNSAGSIGTVSNVTPHAGEIEGFLKTLISAPTIIANDPVIEDPVAFAMEKHLEEFLVTNWEHTELGKSFDIFEDDGEKVGRQYETDAGPIDILAISRDRKALLVVELKRGRASDTVVGQLLRYVGFVKEQIAEADQFVEGAIIALEDDQKLRWALAVVPGISFYRYEIRFKLVKASG